jgi:predicted amidohydrolase YtcJ
MTEDLILFNADIRTMDPSRPTTEALVIRGERLLALGTAEEMAAIAGPGARRIDAGGRLCLPGFQDAHIHLLNGGTDLVETAQLYDCTSLGDLRAALAAHAERHEGPVIWGAGWSCGLFADGALTREVLDAAVPDRPCLIYDDNFHSACLNSAAIAHVGLTDATPDPANGRFVRDAAGRATGMLHEDAIYWAEARLPQTTEATFARGLRAGMAHANRHGITGVMDPQILDRHVRAYAGAEAAGDLTLRVGGACHVRPDDTPDSVLARLLPLRERHRSENFHLTAAKFFLDGGLENRTAALIDPYADAAGGNCGLMFPQEKIDALFTALDAHRFQIHVHSIGDATARAALDGFAAARRANGSWPSLHQIAHCQLVHPDDRARFRELGVMANFQPLWAACDPVFPDATMAMIGPGRAPWTYATRSIIDAGAPFCINSDWAVSTLNPFEIIGTAITREPPRRRGRSRPFFPEERMTLGEAVLGYTVNAAAACWRGGFTGTLRPGFSADLILLDRDIFSVDPYAVAETRVVLTLFQGREVWRDREFAG